MVHSQESFIIANFVSKLRTSSPLSCDCLQQEAEFCESDADVTLYERYIESGRCKKIIQCSLDAFSVIRDVCTGYADLHWNPGLKPGDIATFKIIYPILRSSLDCLLNQITPYKSDHKSKLKDSKEKYDDSSTLTFEGLFLLIKTSLEFIHPLAYSCDGVVLSQLIGLLEKTSYSVQLSSANLSSITVYLCRLYSFGYFIKVPENHELILRQHSVLFYRVILLALSTSGKNVDPNALLFLKRVIGSVIYIINSNVNDSSERINEKLVVFMTKFVDLWYASLVKLLVTIRTDSLPAQLKSKPEPTTTNNEEFETSSESSEESEASEEDDKSEKSSVKSNNPEKSTNSLSQDKNSESSSERESPKPEPKDLTKENKLIVSDKDKLLIKMCKLTCDTPKLPPSHRMRLITQITFVLLETTNEELELEAMNTMLVLLDFSEDANSAILKSNLLPLLKVLTSILMNRMEASGIGLVNVVEEIQLEKYVSLVYCLGQVLSNVVLFKHEYDEENVDKFLQEQIKKLDPASRINNMENVDNKEMMECGMEELRYMENGEVEGRVGRGYESSECIERGLKGQAHSEDSVYVSGRSSQEGRLGRKRNEDQKSRALKKDEEHSSVTVQSWDMELFEMTSNVMKIFNLLLNVNDERVEEAVTQVICWMLTETNFEHTLKLAVPICCFLLRTKNSRMLDAIYGKSGTRVTTTQIALSTSKRWLSGSTIFKTSLENYFYKYVSKEEGVRLEKGGGSLSSGMCNDGGVDGEVDVYSETDTVVKSLFLTVFESYLEVIVETVGKVEEEMEDCLGLYFRCFGLEDYLKRMPLQKLYLVPITNERYHQESFCYMLPVLKRQFKGLKLGVFKKYVLPVLKSLDYFVNKTAQIKYRAVPLPEVTSDSEGGSSNMASDRMSETLRYMNKLESVHKEYEKVYNELLHLCVPLSCDDDGIEVLLEDDYLVLKYIVSLLDLSPSRFNTACRAIASFKRLDKVSLELIGILVKKFINIEINMEKNHESGNMCENILMAIANVSRFCASDMLSRNLQSFEKALNGKRNDALVKLSKSLFPCVNDNLKLTMYKNYLSQPRDKFVYVAIRVALETVIEKLEKNPELLKAVNNSSLNAYKMEQANGEMTDVGDHGGCMVYTKSEDVDMDDEKGVDGPGNPTSTNTLNVTDNIASQTGMAEVGTGDSDNTVTTALVSGANVGAANVSGYDSHGKSACQPGIQSSGQSNTGGNNDNSEGNSGMDLDDPDTGKMKLRRTRGRSRMLPEDGKNRSSSTNKEPRKRGRPRDPPDNHWGKGGVNRILKISSLQDILGDEDESEEGSSENKLGEDALGQQPQQSAPEKNWEEDDEYKFVTIVVKVNGMCELATYLEILTESVDTTKQRMNCLVTFTRLLLFVRENLSNVDYETLVALVTKPLIFECVINCCTKNKNNRANSFEIFNMLCKLNGNYHHVLKVTLSTLYYNHATNREGESVNVGIMKLLCNVFGQFYTEFDNIETLRLVVYLSGRMTQCSYRFYVQLLKFFRVVMVHMNTDHLVQAAPHMMKLFHNERYSNKAKTYVRRLVEKMIIRLKRDHLFSIFPSQHFPLLNNIITTRRRKFNKSLYSSRGPAFRRHKQEDDEDEDEDEEDDFEDDNQKQEPEHAQHLGHLQPQVKVDENVPKNKQHLIVRRRAAAVHKMKKKAMEEKQKQCRYIKVNKKGSRKETVKVLKSIIKNKHK